MSAKSGEGNTNERENESQRYQEDASVMCSVSGYRDDPFQGYENVITSSDQSSLNNTLHDKIKDSL